MKRLSVVGLVILCGIWALSSSACSRNQQTKNPSVAIVDYLEGEVAINGKPTEIGQSLPQKFTVTTGSGSFCGILFDKKNIMHVDENTEAEIDLAGLQKRVNLKAGTLASALKNLPKKIAADDAAFELTTPSTTAGIRGTVFFVKVEDPDNTYVCDCNGVLHLHDPRKGNELTVEASHHKAYRYTKSGRNYSSADADMLYHTDRMMELGAAKIGETIDWTKVDK